METLLTLDRRVFLAVNHLPHTPLSDAVALALSGAGSAGIIWFILTFILFLKVEKKHHWFFLPILLAGIGSGGLVNLILKPFIARSRPDLLMGAMVIGDSSFDYSFPSGHATMSFAAAVVLSGIEPKRRRLFWMLAILISLSRIYLGVHFPLDVLVGALLGLGIGFTSTYVCYHVLERGNKRSLP